VIEPRHSIAPAFFLDAGQVIKVYGVYGRSRTVSLRNGADPTLGGFQERLVSLGFGAHKSRPKARRSSS
jgi:hypothetical protein